jgi:hypothetical protein
MLKIVRRAAAKKIMKHLIDFPKSAIDKICSDSPDLITAFLAMYKVAIPKFEETKKIQGFPLVSETTAKYCIEKLSQKTNDAWSVNSLWLNKGFSSEFNFPDWKISTKKLTLTF